MIISASRRTDIPAFYSRWFLNRLREGYVLVRNPMNPTQVSRIDLDRGITDGIVFWTKNPRPMMEKPDRSDNLEQLDHLEQLEQLGFSSYYFLFTITPYGQDLEKHLPPEEEIMDTFIHLSQRIGKARVIWRYDPVLLTGAIDIDYHRRQFRYMAERLGEHTETCIFSFLDMYKKCQRNLKNIDIQAITQDDMLRLAGIFKEISHRFGIRLVSCAESIDLTPLGVAHGKCIDDDLLEHTGGFRLKIKKDKNQRKTCQCVESTDIGAYDTCGHGCLYCYANADMATALSNRGRHNPDSPLLLGELSPQDTITRRSGLKSFRVEKNIGALANNFQLI